MCLLLLVFALQVRNILSNLFDLLTAKHPISKIWMKFEGMAHEWVLHSTAFFIFIISTFGRKLQAMFFVWKSTRWNKAKIMIEFNSSNSLFGAGSIDFASPKTQIVYISASEAKLESNTAPHHQNRNTSRGKRVNSFFYSVGIWHLVVCAHFFRVCCVCAAWCLLLI